MAYGDECFFDASTLIFIECLTVFVLVFVVVGPASVIAFIIRDLGSPGLVGWIIQVCSGKRVVASRVIK